MWRSRSEEDQNKNSKFQKKPVSVQGVAEFKSDPFQPPFRSISVCIHPKHPRHQESSIKASAVGVSKEFGKSFSSVLHRCRLHRHSAIIAIALTSVSPLIWQPSVHPVFTSRKGSEQKADSREREEEKQRAGFFKSFDFS